jgi:hypothetical protein
MEIEILKGQADCSLATTSPKVMWPVHELVAAGLPGRGDLLVLGSVSRFDVAGMGDRRIPFCSNGFATWLWHWTIPG